MPPELYNPVRVSGFLAFFGLAPDVLGHPPPGHPEEKRQSLLALTGYDPDQNLADLRVTRTKFTMAKGNFRESFTVAALRGWLSPPPGGRGRGGLCTPPPLVTSLSHTPN